MQLIILLLNKIKHSYRFEHYQIVYKLIYGIRYAYRIHITTNIIFIHKKVKNTNNLIVISKLSKTKQIDSLYENSEALQQNK